jgi:S-adenosylmethionine:tRNA ribosyltransferase-isomerase
MKKSDFEYELPEHLIAQTPPQDRQGARLMVVHRESQIIEHRLFSDFLEYLSPTDLLVFNNTKVIPARFFGQKASGGQVEILLERMISDVTALAQIRASRAPKAGTVITLADSDTQVRVLGREGRFFTLEFPSPGLSAIAAAEGQIPLPPYIKRAPAELDASRYQTVFAECEGAVAAPTAGLHFDEPMLAAIDDLGIDRTMLTLHVGAGTFQPVQVDDILQHQMHQEWFSLPPDTASRVQAQSSRGHRVLAIGTTSVRALESAVVEGGVQSMQG